MTEPVMCSVFCVTYNHKNYIGKALESILDQNTSHRFEVIVHDDCSTDGTSDIVDDIAKHYPGRVTVVRPEANRYSRDRFAFYSDVFKLCKGKYIALLDGDDYWIDVNKLDDDINYLERHANVSMLFSAAEQVNEDTGTRKVRNKYPDGTEFSLEYIIKTGGGFFPTSTSVFRREVFENEPDWFHCHTTLDYPMAILAALKGKVRYRDSITGLYHSHVASFSHIIESDSSIYSSKVNRNFELNKGFVNNLGRSGLLNGESIERLLLKENYVRYVKLHSAGVLSFFVAIRYIDGFGYKVRFIIRTFRQCFKL